MHKKPLTAHEKFELRHAHKKAARSDKPTAEQVSAAMEFGMALSPRDLSARTNIGIGTLENMAKGRIAPSRNQQRAIITAVRDMGMTPV